MYLHILSVTDQPARSHRLAATAEITQALPEEALKALETAEHCKVFLLVQGCESLTGDNQGPPEALTDFEMVWRRKLVRFGFPNMPEAEHYEILIGLNNDLNDPGATLLLEVIYNSNPAQYKRVFYKITREGVLRADY